MAEPRFVKEIFDSISGKYDLLNALLSFRRDRVWRRAGVAALPHGGNIRILDLASGTLGLALQYLLDGPGEVHCLDFSYAMLLQGKTKIRSSLEGRVHLTCADALCLPYEGGFFDAAMCAWGIRNFRDPMLTLREVRRVLKPGGLFLVLEFFRPTTILAKTFTATYGRFVMPWVGSWVSGQPKAYQYLHDSVNSFYSLEEFCAGLEGEGFEIRKRQNLTCGVTSMIVGQA